MSVVESTDPVEIRIYAADVLAVMEEAYRGIATDRSTYRQVSHLMHVALLMTIRSEEKEETRAFEYSRIYIEAIEYCYEVTSGWETFVEDCARYRTMFDA